MMCVCLLLSAERAIVVVSSAATPRELIPASHAAQTTQGTATSHTRSTRPVLTAADPTVNPLDVLVHSNNNKLRAGAAIQQYSAAASANTSAQRYYSQPTPASVPTTTTTATTTATATTAGSNAASAVSPSTSTWLCDCGMANPSHAAVCQACTTARARA